MSIREGTMVLLVVIATVINLSCNREMEYKEFTSEHGWFTMKIPGNWERFKDQEGTYAFYDEKYWTGNFRITPIRWETKSGIDKVPEYLNQEFEENISKNPQRIKLGNHESIFYKDYYQQDDEETLIYYWTLGKDNTLIVCSFSTDKEREGTRETEAELVKVENIISSLQIH